MSRLATEGAPADAAERDLPLLSRRRRRFSRRRVGSALAPYALVAPTAAIIGAVLAYPLYLLVRLSFQKYGLFELVRHQGKPIGLGNYTRILHDHQFWTVLARTVAFTVVNVSLTIVLGTAIALLLTKLGRAMRLLLTTGLVLVWAMPPVVAVNVWRWMVDYEFGVANWTLTKLHFGNFLHHDWFANPWTGFGVITAVVVWGAIPFVAITVYAGLAQVPQELLEAARIDGARGWNVFREVTLPLLMPIFVILISLSIIWDFQVFIQVWIMLGNRPSSDYFLLSMYSFVESFRISEYGFGAAIAVVMVLVMFGATLVYIRQMVRTGEAT
ncbi:MAG: N,N-diacetylchitobiose transport system permease protein [Gaiellaceae bacterium]|nr:N,N-diacetylchitobiose transport system permease protein [Gaiellaceae bacterium]MDX6517507.1 N,N-diacetylchitobiose transport system permease protein [Gaiellaceae bacterium]